MSDPAADDDDGPDDEELAELADDLSTVLRELRDELRSSREAEAAEPVGEATSGGVGPELSIDLPSASDVLAFTDERLIPAAITVLEVNIRALELLQKGIRWARPDRAGENARAVRSHAESVSRSTLERLDTVLADLQDAAGEGALPENAEASGVITEARELRDEIDSALEERADAREDDSPELPGEEGANDEADDDPPSPWDERPEVDVDVEGELESIKAELGKDEGEAGPPEEDGQGVDGEDQSDGEDDADETDAEHEAATEDAGEGESGEDEFREDAGGDANEADDDVNEADSDVNGADGDSTGEPPGEDPDNSGVGDDRDG